MKKIISFIVVLAMILSVSSFALAVPSSTYNYDATGNPIIVNISTPKGLSDFSKEFKTEINGKSKNLTVNITDDINMSGEPWTPIEFNSYSGSNPNIIIINGNNHTISNLQGMLVSETWTGEKLYINNLTLSNANAVSDGSGNKGVGAFVGYVGATKEIILENCKLINSKVTGDDWTGGLIGYVAGYSKMDDGPVFTTVTINNCEVENNVIEGPGSTGGIVGHATGDNWTQFTITGGKVADNIITCTDNNDKKAGDIIGTVGVAGLEKDGHKGYVEVNTTAENNTVTSNGVQINRIYGRFGSKGELRITGGKYDTSRDNHNDANKPDDGTLIVSSEPTTLFAGEVDPNTSPKPTEKPASSGIKVTYNGGNSFSTSKSDVPTGVEIDGVAVPFNGTGSNFTVGCVDPGAKWVTVRWNSTSVTTNFTPDALVECSVSIPKTGDMPVWAAVLALFGF